MDMKENLTQDLKVETNSLDTSSTESSLKAEIEALKDQLLRAQAEIENTRKRAKIEQEESQKFALNNFARDLLQVSDSLEQALSHFIPKELEKHEFLSKVAEGIHLTHQGLQKVFERYHIKRIYPLGEKFNPHYHQAMFEEPTDGTPGMVVSILQPGYLLNERLLRPAMVGVSKLAQTLH